jgi:hypothetical protein
LLALGATMARPIFEFIGHAAVIREQEIAYFRILMLVASPMSGMMF